MEETVSGWEAGETPGTGRTGSGQMEHHGATITGFQGGLKEIETV